MILKMRQTTIGDLAFRRPWPSGAPFKTKKTPDLSRRVSVGLEEETKELSHEYLQNGHFHCQCSLSRSHFLRPLSLDLVRAQNSTSNHVVIRKTFRFLIQYEKETTRFGLISTRTAQIRVTDSRYRQWTDLVSQKRIPTHVIRGKKSYHPNRGISGIGSVAQAINIAQNEKRHRI